MEQGYRQAMIKHIIRLYKLESGRQPLGYFEDMRESLQCEPDYELLNIRDFLEGCPNTFYCE